MVAKKYAEKVKLVERGKIYSIAKAVELVKQLSISKFDGTIELSINLGVDPKQSDQQVRGTVSLPHGLGKKIVVVVIAKGDKAKEAEDAGADVVGTEELIQKIEGGWTEFDVLIATPDMMAKVGKLGKILGRKGLMPSPKGGTVTADVGKAVKEFKAGKLEFKVDKQGIIHLPIGKVSFEAKKLEENYLAIYNAIVRAKPSGAKGVYIKSIYLAPTMGPSVKVETIVKGEE
ncbi:MAG: 50S ribosomal protein L1 [Candidatus Margulisbacteria bacterium]|nr:50S ribosomal protein L1 [Candidatus Margulisiibacteriota bacterium]